MMPISKKRKRKDGKKAKYTGSKIKVDPNKESSVTFQDLINVLAVQEFQAGRYTPSEEESLEEVCDNEGRSLKVGEVIRQRRGEGAYKIADDVEIHMADTIPVYVGEGPDRVQVGTAEREPGDDRLNITITDPDVVDMVQGQPDHYSIDKENTK